MTGRRQIFSNLPKGRIKSTGQLQTCIIDICLLQSSRTHHLMNFFEGKQLLCDKQHGFRKHRSCESQLLTTVKDLASGIDNSQQINASLSVLMWRYNRQSSAKRRALALTLTFQKHLIRCPIKGF